MSQGARRQFIKTGSIFLGAIWLDQLTKWLFWSERVINTGISFSVGQQLSPWLLTTLLVGFMLWLAVKLWSVLKTSSDFRIAYGLFFGGAFSNLFDRIMWGGVVDIWQIPVLGLRNNLADWLIVSSAVYVMVISLYNSQRRINL